MVLGCHAGGAGPAAAGADGEQIEVVLLGRAVASAIAAASCMHLHMPGMCPGHAPWLGICHREFEASALCHAYLQAPLLDTAVWPATSCQHAAAMKRRSACSWQHGGILATQATMFTCTWEAACSSS